MGIVKNEVWAEKVERMESSLRRVVDTLMEQRDQLVDEVIAAHPYSMASLYDADEVEGLWDELWRECRATFEAGLKDKCYLTGEKAEKIISVMKIYHDGEQEYYDKLRSEWMDRCDDEEEEEVMKQAWFDLLEKRMEYHIIKLAQEWAV